MAARCRSAFYSSSGLTSSGKNNNFSDFQKLLLLMHTWMQDSRRTNVTPVVGVWKIYLR